MATTSSAAMARRIYEQAARYVPVLRAAMAACDALAMPWQNAATAEHALVLPAPPRLPREARTTVRAAAL